MSSISSRRVFARSAVVALALVFLAAAPAAARKMRSTSNRGKWVEFDAAASTVTVKITTKGKGPNRKLVRKGTEVTFNVIPTGSVLKRTTVAFNGVTGELTEIKPGDQVLIYWLKDPHQERELFARKIDVVSGNVISRGSVR